MDIDEAAIQTIRLHAMDTYPEECCGVLLGTSGRTSLVRQAARVENRSAAHRERRYTIDAATLFRITKDAEKSGLDVVGFYHSHPDHPAQPSQTDLNEATFPTYIYMIQSVREGNPAELTAWTLAPDRSEFVAEEIRTRKIETS